MKCETLEPNARGVVTSYNVDDGGLVGRGSPVDGGARIAHFVDGCTDTKCHQMYS